MWEQRGGNRVSLWQPGGAASTTLLKPFEETRDDDEWNFSTTNDFTDDILSRFASEPDEQSTNLDHRQVGSRSSSATWHQREQESRARRGEAKMGRLFDENAAPYEYSSEINEGEQDSDLALSLIHI